MQMKSNPKPAENASVSRRRFLAGAVAVPVVVVAPAAVEAVTESDDSYHEMMFALDARAEIVERHTEAIRVYDKISLQPDRPQQFPSVSLLQFFGQEHTDYYYRGHQLTNLSMHPERVSFHDFFAEQIDLAINRATCRPYEWSGWPEVKARDYARVTAALHAQAQARETWEIESGYRAADAEVDRILDEDDVPGRGVAEDRRSPVFFR